MDCLDSRFREIKKLHGSFFKVDSEKKDKPTKKSQTRKLKPEQYILIGFKISCF